MLPKFPHESTVTATLHEAVTAGLISHSFGCFKVIDLGSHAPPIPLQILMANRLDDDWYRVTMFNPETGAIMVWQCGAETPVYVMREDDDNEH